MKKLTSKWVTKLMKFAALNSLVLFIAANSVNVTCMFNHHQPVVPEAIKKLRRF